MISNEEYRAIHEFYYLEAELLDDHNLEAWYGLLSPHIRYYAPLRAFYDRVEGRPYGDSPYFDDDYQSIKIRIEQQKTPQYTIAENPYTCVRRFVTNIFPRKEGEQYLVSSHILAYRTRSTQARDPFILAAKRKDTLYKENGQFKLYERWIDLDIPVIRSPNLSFFL